MVNNLVGGQTTPLKNDGVKVSWDDDIPNIWKNKKCSKPPSSYCIFLLLLLVRELYIIYLMFITIGEGIPIFQCGRPKNVGLPQAAQVHKPQFTPHDPLATTCTSTFVNFVTSGAPSSTCHGIVDPQREVETLW